MELQHHTCQYSLICPGLHLVRGCWGCQPWDDSMVQDRFDCCLQLSTCSPTSVHLLHWVVPVPAREVGLQ